MAVKEKERTSESGLRVNGETVMTQTAPISDTGLIRRAFYEEKKRRKAPGAKTVLRYASLLGGGFFLAFCPMPLGTYPLGAAFLAAVVGGVPDILFTLFGVIAGSMFITGGVYPAAVRFASAAMAGALVFARVGYRYRIGPRNEGRFCEPLYVRLIICAATLLAFSVLRLAAEGLSGQSAAGLFFTVSLGTSATYLYSVLFDKGLRRSDLFGAGAVFALATFTAALCPTVIAGTSLAVFISPFAAVFFGVAGGQARGGLAGAVTGCAMYLGHAMIAGESATLLSVISLSATGYLAGLFRNMNAAVRFTVPAVVGAGISLCTEGEAKLLSAILCVTATILVNCFSEEIAERRMFETDSGAGAVCGDYMNDMMMRRREKDMRRLTKSFSALSDIFANLSMNFRKPERNGVRGVCSDVINKYCVNCGRRDDCSACDGSVGGSEKLIDRLADGIRAGRDDCFFAECPNGEKISKELNDGITVLFEESLKNDKTGLFSSEYASVAKLLSATAPVGEEYKRDRLLSERLTKAFSGKDFFADVIAVCGRRRKAVIAGGADVSRSMMGASQIKGLCERVCGVSFSEPEFTAAERNMIMLLEQRRVYNIVASKRESRKNGENICGDSSIMFYGDDRFYSVICDGMGSGSEAAVVSRICLAFTEKMLSGGNKTDIALSMLNNFVRSKADECPSAMDILSVDLLNGDGVFTKCGAAASYVLRKNKLFKITSKTPPVGIMEEQRQDSVPFEFRSGDVFLMISDGVLCETLGDDEFDRKIGELMRFSDGDTSESAADRIIAFAAAESGGRDDMTVIVGRVGVNPEK